jgi:hypothetical protein
MANCSNAGMLKADEAPMAAARVMDVENFIVTCLSCVRVKVARQLRGSEFWPGTGPVSYSSWSGVQENHPRPAGPRGPRRCSMDGSW